MILLPAIDLLGGRAVRLYQGDYRQATVYDESPLHTALVFQAAGAQWLHLVDLDGARSGKTDNLAVVRELCANTTMQIELGGGVRSMDTIALYLDAGVRRVILGTAAVTDPGLAAAAAVKYGDAIAVGVDLRDGYVAVKGWTQQTALSGPDFCQRMQEAGVQTLICTDIARDGAMAGTNLDLYRRLKQALRLNLIASGGVSSLEDIAALRELGLYGAILGKAYYTGAVDLNVALQTAKGAALC